MTDPEPSEVDRLTSAINEQTAEARGLRTDSKNSTAQLLRNQLELSKYLKLVGVGLVLNLIGVLLMSFLLYEFQQDSQERSRIASEQRKQQTELVERTRQEAIQVNRCVIISDTEAEFNRCVGGN